MSPNTIPYFGSSNPYIVSSMNRNYCVHPYSHIPKANGLEPQNKKKTVYTWSFLKQKNTFSYKEIFKTDNHGISSPAKTFCLYKVYIFFLNLTCLGDTSKEIRTEPSKPHFTAKKPIFHIQFNYLRDFTLAAVTPCNCFSISSGKWTFSKRGIFSCDILTDRYTAGRILKPSIGLRENSTKALSKKPPSKTAINTWQGIETQSKKKNSQKPSFLLPVSILAGQQTEKVGSSQVLPPAPMHLKTCNYHDGYKKTF